MTKYRSLDSTWGVVRQTALPEPEEMRQALEETGSGNGLTLSIPGWVVALCLLISVAGIADHDLWTPDEHREAAIALSMSRTGNVVIPDLAGEPFVEKPPLYYILASSALSLLGPALGNTSALRMTSALWGLATLGMTWFLAKRLMKRDQAVLSMLALGTMPGFIHVTHWILVDNALVFFVVAALWGFAQAYEGDRGRFLPLAGLFTAGAFLSKGVVGLVVIGLGWAGLAVPWMMRKGRCRVLAWQWVGLHLLAFLLFAGVALSWVLALRLVGGPDLWNEWFWTNQFGRFTGQAMHLGHIQGPFYYLEIMPVYMLPWIVVFVVGLAGLVFRICRGKPLARPWPFLLLWGVGGLILLSLSSTKRDIYLIVLLPAFAMMTGLMLSSFAVGPSIVRSANDWRAAEVRPWVRKTLLSWTFVSLLILALASAAPGLVPAIRAVAPGAGTTLNGILDGWRLVNSLAVTAVALMVILMTRKRLPFLHRWFAVTALTYIMFLVLFCPIIDRVKSYGPAFRTLAKGIVERSEGEVAAWNADETTRAGFYYYSNLVFPAVSDIVELESVLEGTHNRFSGVIVCLKNFPPPDATLPPWSVVQSVRMGPRRVLQWIRGKKREAD